jgi:hypothetical protein
MQGKVTAIQERNNEYRTYKIGFISGEDQCTYYFDSFWREKDSSFISKLFSKPKRRVTDENVVFNLGHCQIVFPYRLYTVDIGDSILEKLDITEKTILHCIYSRSCNGHVREKHIRALLSMDFPDWVIPYIVKVCDEYIVEIVQMVYDNLKDKNTGRFKAFCADNHDTFCRSYNRMISYWNVFYRDRYSKFDSYVGRKLFIECFGAKRTMKLTGVEKNETGQISKSEPNNKTPNGGE